MKQWPRYTEEEIKAVERVLRSGKVNQWTGTEVFAFEKEYARHLGVRYAVALSNGSVALDIALKVIGAGKGDEVIVTPRSFVASAGCAALIGAKPVFADVDMKSGNITLESIKKVISKRTKAVIAVHLAGWPCEIDRIRSFCKKKKIILIEDCAQAHGAKFKGRYAGSFGDIACFSFCQDKIISTGGEGGLLATNNEKFWKAAWALKDHGRIYDLAYKNEFGIRFKWLIGSFGTNNRMTEMQAAIGRSMLKKLPQMVNKRRKLASMLDKGLNGINGLRTAIPKYPYYHSYYRYYAYTIPSELKKGWDRSRIFGQLIKAGIQCSVGVCPEIYLERPFKKLLGTISLPNAKEIGENSLMFNIHPLMDAADIKLIINTIKRTMKKAAI